ncbi:hypothetical protein MRX96_041521 [Rhipicephalus microplus]
MTPQGISSLTIAHTELEDFAEYVVEAKNRYGIDTTRAELIQLDLNSMRPMRRIHRADHRLSLDFKSMRPRFEVPLQSTYHKPLGFPVTLECTVRGRPKPTVQWFHNGVLIEPSYMPVYKITLLSDKSMLHISEMMPATEGLYVCKASNEAGEKTTECILHAGVTPPPEKPEKTAKESAIEFLTTVLKPTWPFSMFRSASPKEAPKEEEQAELERPPSAERPPSVDRPPRPPERERLPSAERPPRPDRPPSTERARPDRPPSTERARPDRPPSTERARPGRPPRAEMQRVPRPGEPAERPTLTEPVQQKEPPRPESPWFLEPAEPYQTERPPCGRDAGRPPSGRRTPEAPEEFVKWKSGHRRTSEPGMPPKFVAPMEDVEVLVGYPATTTPEDFGDFVCEAKNRYGTEVTEAELIQIDMKSMLPMRKTPKKVNKLDLEFVPMKPRFEQPLLSEVRAPLGMPITLECVARGRPPPEVRWFHEEKPILPDDTGKF